MLTGESMGTPIGGITLLAVVIGASAGGPKALQELLTALPADFPAPIAVCQHMTPGATAPWAAHLNEVCRLRVVEATHAEPFVAGTVFIARAGWHLRIRGTAREPWTSVERDFADVLHVPSIDFLMSSAADIFGSRTLGVLLTGMGSDGALGMQAIRRSGGVTIAQSEDSAFMASMPRSAAEMGAVGETVALDHMTQVIVDRVAGLL